MAERTCSIEGCGGRTKARGWCAAHYRRWHYHGDPCHPAREREGPTADGLCTVGGCTERWRTRGWCPRHYARWRAHGDPLASAAPRPRPVERFWAKVDKRGPVPVAAPHLGPCWIWTAGIGEGGYGQFAPTARQTVRAHRYAYELVVGSIPKGLVPRPPVRCPAMRQPGSPGARHERRKRWPTRDGERPQRPSIARRGDEVPGRCRRCARGRSHGRGHHGVARGAFQSA